MIFNIILIFQFQIICPNAFMGCTFTCNRKNLHDHLLCCTFSGISKEKDLEDRQLTKEAVIMECEEERIRRQMHLSIGSGYWSERSEVSERSLVRSLIVLCIILIKIEPHLLLLSIFFLFISLSLAICLSLSLYLSISCSFTL